MGRVHRLRHKRLWHKIRGQFLQSLQRRYNIAGDIYEVLWSGIELRQVMRYNEEHPTARQVTARQAELERELEEMEQRILDLEFFRQGLEVDKDWATGQN